MIRNDAQRVAQIRKAKNDIIFDRGYKGAFLLKLIMAGLLAVATLYSADDPIIEPSQRTDATFRLFRTQNIFNFLELDTRNGRVWQVQWSSDANNRIVSPINSTRLEGEAKPGRFTLYPTSNIFTFMLLDQENGYTWQVQWGLKPGGAAHKPYRGMD